jgi:hypothetical protein
MTSVSTKSSQIIVALLVVHIIWSIIFAYVTHNQTGNNWILFAWIVSIIVCLTVLITYLKA